MSIRHKLLELYKTGFSSSPITIDDDELNIIMSKDCLCENCGKDIFEMYDFPSFRDGGMFCEDCYLEEFFTVCAICESHFENPETPEEFQFVVTRELYKDSGIPMGIYQVLKYPFYYGNILSGFENFLDDSISMVKKIDVNSIDKFYGCDLSRSGEICPECFEKYTGKTRHAISYIDKSYRIHHNITMRGFINAGTAYQNYK